MNEDLEPRVLPEEILSVPEGNWIVLSADERRIVAHHPELTTALRQAEERGEKNGVIMQAYGLGKHWVI
jgi:hypothetical protein